MLKTILKLLAFFSVLFFLMACPSPVNNDNGDAAAVANAMKALSLEYKAADDYYPTADSADSVTADITLPSTGMEDTTVTWTSSNENVIGTDGSVTRPEPDAEDVSITLTATISKGSAKDTTEFTLTVKKKTAVDVDIDTAESNLAIPYAGADNADSVTADITLPSLGSGDTTVTWESDNEAIVIQNGQATVNRPLSSAADAEVTLTATISKQGGRSITKAFTLTVKKSDDATGDSLMAAKSALNIGYGGSDSADSVTQNITLPDTGEHDSTITWESADPAIISDAGIVTRKVFADGEGHEQVILTATITIDSSFVTKSFTLTVLEEDPSDQQAVDVTKADLSVSYAVGDNQNAVTMDFELPAEGKYGTGITWSSDNTAIEISQTPSNGVYTATVTRPDSATGNDVPVILEATISKGTTEETKQFFPTVEASGKPEITGSISYVIPTVTYGADSTITVESQGLDGLVNLAYALVKDVPGITVNAADGLLTISGGGVQAGVHSITVELRSSDTTGTLEWSGTITVEKKSLTGESLTYSALTTVRDADSGNTASPLAGFLVAGDDLAEVVDFAIAKTGTEGSGTDSDVSISTDGVVTVKTDIEITATEYTVTATAKTDGSYADSTTGTITVTVGTPSIDGEFDHSIPTSITYGEGATYSVESNTVTGESVTFALENPVTGITVAANGEITVAADLDAGEHHITVKAAALGLLGTVTKGYTITIDPKSISAASLTYASLTVDRDASTGNTVTPTLTSLNALLVSGDSLSNAVSFSIAKTGTSGTGTDGAVSVDDNGVVTVITSTVFTTTEYTVTATAKTDGNYDGSAFGTISVTVNTPPMSGNFDYTIPASITYGDAPEYDISTNSITTTQGLTFALETPVTGITVAPGDGKITVAEDLAVGNYDITVKATSPDFTGEISQDESINVQKKSITGTTLTYSALTLAVNAQDNTSNSPTVNFLVGGDTLADAVDFSITGKNGLGPDMDAGSIAADGVITVNTATNFTATVYTVTATAKGNYDGSTTGDISITVTADDVGPGKPGNFAVSTESNGDVKLIWAEPTDKGIYNNQTATITAYTIYYSTSSTFTKDNAETTIPDLDSALTSHTITSGLTAGTEYHFLMTATNGHGEGGVTDTLSTYTNSAPGAPTLTLSTTSTGVSVDWDVTDLGYFEGAEAALTGINIYYADQSSVGTGDTSKSVSTTSATGSENIDIADPGVEYYFIATATNGAATGSPTSPAVSVTLDKAPGAPTNFSATGGAAAVTLSWGAPSDLGYKDNAEGSITSYHIYYKEGSSVTKTDYDNTATAASTDRSKTISSLAVGTQYAFIMTAETGAGVGTATAIATVYTNAAPGAPTLTSVTGGNEEATLTWTAPTDTGYSGGSKATLSGYYIYYSMTSGFDKDAASGVTKSGLLGVGASPHTITGLTTAGTQYYFLVTAANAAAEGAASNEESTYTDGDPGAPTLVVTATSTGVSVGWTVSDPGYSGGSAASVTEIDIYYADQTGVTTTSGGTHVSVSTTSATGSEAITIDDPGVEYYFIATATTGAGTSVASSEASVILNKAPGAPTSFTATGGDEEVTLNWAAPSDLGYVNGVQGAITGYTIYYLTTQGVTIGGSGVTTVAVQSGTATTQTISGLDAGKQYYFIMTAKNAAGDSAATDERATHTDTVPEKPTGVSLSGGDQRVTLTWTAPGNTGYKDGSAATLTGYNIYYSQNSGFAIGDAGVTTTPVNSGTATTQEISIATPGTYYFIMTAKTDAGESSPTTVESFTISPAFSSGEVTMIVNEIITRVGTAASEQVTFGGSLTAGTDYNLSLQRPPGASSSVTIDDSGSITVANTVAADDGGQYTVIATGTGGKKLSAAFTLTLYDTDLADLLLNGGTIPADLNSSDEFTKTILADYNAGATMTALYFTENGAGNKDGSSWADAFPGADLRDELQRVSHYAAAAGKGYFILVGAGTYKPTDQMTMWDHTAIIGGWPASGGWIRGGAETIFDGEKQRRLFANLFKSVTNAKLYGAVIQNGSNSADGGAVFNGGSTTTFIDVRFLNNTSGGRGGAVHDSGGSIKFSNVAFEGNTSTATGTGKGGGALFSDGSTIEFTDVVFKDNKADAYGGAQYNSTSSLEYSRVKFLNNESGDSGGALYSTGGSVKFSHAIFDGNKNNFAEGGAVFVSSATSASLSHVTFKDNTATRVGGGLYFWSTPNAKVSHATFHGNQGLGSAVGISTNATVWLNQVTITENVGGAVIFQENSSSVITNTLIWGNKGSTGTSAGLLTFRLGPTSGNTDVLTVYNSLWEGGTWVYDGVKSLQNYGQGTITHDLGNNIITDGTEAAVLGSLMTSGDEYLRTYALTTGSLAQNAGIYVQRGTDGTYYYSTDNTAWYSDPGLNTSVTLPVGTEELTAKDVPGNNRNGVPDIGAYELQ